ncbi:MAG: ribosome biogenesis GTP-binding protein YihA/YsxC [Bacteroidia bacterium]
MRRYRYENKPLMKPVVALSGRSNVGKSSLLNSLLGTRAAAVSQSPGCTRAIWLYEPHDEGFLWADLPGYGYATVSQSQRHLWRRETLAFIRQVRPLVCVLIDSRLPPQELDKAWVQVLQAEGIPYILVANKVDKLNQSQRYHQQEVLSQAFDGAVWRIFVSARTQAGIPSLKAWIKNYFASQQEL